MNRQLPLTLALRPRLVLEDFVPGNNAAVLAAANALLEGGESQLFVAGPAGAGRTHLLLGISDAAERRGLTNAYLPLRMAKELPTAVTEGLDDLALLALDDVDTIAGDPGWEAALFALYNRARARGTRLVFSASSGPAALRLHLADLRSRLAWGLCFQLEPLDDAGKSELLTREAARRGLLLPSEVASYVLARCPRDVRDLMALLDRLDQAALAAQRRLTIPFVRDQLRAG